MNLFKKDVASKLYGQFQYLTNVGIGNPPEYAAVPSDYGHHFRRGLLQEENCSNDGKLKFFKLLGKIIKKIGDKELERDYEELMEVSRYIRLRILSIKLPRVVHERLLWFR